jgi:predicted branched-subunit amino acid permease
MPTIDPGDRATAAGDDLRGAFLVGARGVAPLLLGVAPFGLVAGVASIEADIGVSGAVAFSTIVFAGASQLAAINLLAEQAPLVVVIVTGLVINLRMVMYSASLAPHLGAIPRRTRVAAAYLLTDQAYAVSIIDYELEPGRTPGERLWVYLGAGGTLWSTWQVTTVAGAVGGGAIPESVPLGFAVPLAFLSLLVPAVTDRPTLVAAIVGGTMATVGAAWPSNIGMPLGATLGVLVGWLVGRRAAVPAAPAPRTDGGPDDTDGGGSP